MSRTARYTWASLSGGADGQRLRFASASSSATSSASVSANSAELSVMKRLRRVKLFAVGENIGKPQFASDRARYVRVQLAVLDEANYRGAAQAEDLRGLLGGNFLVAGQDAYRLAVAECVGDPLEDLVKLLGQFDAIMFASTGQEEGRLRRGPVTDLVRLDEAQDIRKPIGIGRNWDDNLCGGGASRVSLPLIPLSEPDPS